MQACRSSRFYGVTRSTRFPRSAYTRTVLRASTRGLPSMRRKGCPILESECISKSNEGLNPPPSTCHSRRRGRISPSAGNNGGGEARSVPPNRTATCYSEATVYRSTKDLPVSRGGGCSTAEKRAAHGPDFRASPWPNGYKSGSPLRSSIQISHSCEPQVDGSHRLGS